MARKIGAVSYCECSARTGKGVADVFRTAAHEVLLVQDKSKAKAKKSKSKFVQCMVF